MPIFSSFSQASCLFQPTTFAPDAAFHQNALLGPIYQPEALRGRREIWVSVSAQHLVVWIWANYLTSLSFSFPLVNGENSFQHRLLWRIRWDNVHTGLTQEICSLWFSSSNPLSKAQFSSGSISATFLPATSDTVHMYLLSNSFCNYYMFQIINDLIYIFYF